MVYGTGTKKEGSTAYTHVSSTPDLENEQKTGFDRVIGSQSEE